jgi:NAD(P)-dependent dehydrogenase (short-subunit alcohol dehydrogenase family)/ketosteroid isomerase-like protein
MQATDARVWFITGASSGLGRALAEAALSRGHRVVATARDPVGVADLEDEHPGRVHTARLDVTNPDEVRAAVDSGLSAFGRLDVVVNNAGYGLFGALEEFSDEELRRAFETNVFGALTVLRTTLPHLRRQRSGHIVQISSLEGVAPLAAGESAYAGVKFALEGVAEVLDKEVAHLGIGVTIVEPGPVRTDFAASSTAVPPQSADYADSVGKALEWFQDLAGSQPNDPTRVAEAIVDAVEDEDPPLRLALGDEAVAAIRRKLDGQSRELDAWKRLSTTTGFDTDDRPGEDEDYVALAKRLINRPDGNWQPLLDRLADDVVFKVTIPDGTPIRPEFRGKEAVTEHFEHLGDLLEFRQERPMEFFGRDDRVIVLGRESFEIKANGVTVTGSEYADVLDFHDGQITHFLVIQDLSAVVDAYR